MIAGTIIIAFLIGALAGALAISHLAAQQEQRKQAEIATGTPLAYQVAHELGFDLWSLNKPLIDYTHGILEQV
jgi:hypothetical protein